MPKIQPEDLIGGEVVEAGGLEDELKIRKNGKIYKVRMYDWSDDDGCMGTSWEIEEEKTKK